MTFEKQTIYFWKHCKYLKILINNRWFSFGQYFISGIFISVTFFKLTFGRLSHQVIGLGPLRVGISILCAKQSPLPSEIISWTHLLLKRQLIRRTTRAVTTLVTVKLPPKWHLNLPTALPKQTELVRDPYLPGCYGLCFFLVQSAIQTFKNFNCLLPFLSIQMCGVLP